GGLARLIRVTRWLGRPPGCHVAEVVRPAESGRSAELCVLGRSRVKALLLEVAAHLRVERTDFGADRLEHEVREETEQELNDHRSSPPSLGRPHPTLTTLRVQCDGSMTRRQRSAYDVTGRRKAGCRRKT